MDWYTLFLTIITIVGIIKGIKHIKSDSRNNKAINHFIEHREKEKVNQVISKHESKEIKINNNELGLLTIELTPRIYKEVNTYEKTFTSRGVVKDTQLSLTLTILNEVHPVQIIGENKFIDGVAIILSGTGSESDNFLRTLINLWNIEKTGKPRMKSNILCYSTDLNLSEVRLDKIFRFTCRFGIEEKRQIEPVLIFEMDWGNGIFRISEHDQLHRELIINRIMN